MTSNGQKKTLEVFKDLFLKPGLPSTYSNLQLWAQSSGYPALAEEAKEAANTRRRRRRNSIGSASVLTA